ncbi:hypothetical protein DNTS_012452 [Danionella cerebrum]|uniref:Uncharacterized protein n=1 Tax=Danionella cerebrum TaxID=2873325 RepID=A0A553QPC4_9TELE|nr:hypothetical protein DNTS_012452 [Danionella translucida]
MLDERVVVWRHFLTPAPEDVSRLPVNGSTEEPIWSSTVAIPGYAEGRLPSLSTYLALFVCLLLFLLVLMVVMLYRMKHTIAPSPSDVESARETEITSEDSSEVSSSSSD